jgi:titin
LIDLGNASVGVNGEFGSNPDNNLIGGTTPAARNIISGNGAAGIEFNFASGNVIRGNFIGLGSDGTTDIGNNNEGVRIAAFTGGFMIGGDDAADGATDGVVNARNIISGNGGAGIFLGQNHFIQGNYIGTDVTGTLARPNNGGVTTNISHNTVVGGATAGAGNLISGNNGVGVGVFFTSNFVVKGNRIGTQADGVAALGNTGEGVAMFVGSSGTQVGGTAAAKRTSSPSTASTA